MDINLTLIVELVFFALFYTVVRVTLWPLIVGALDERHAHIQESLRQADLQKSNAEKQAQLLRRQQMEHQQRMDEEYKKAEAQIEKILIEAKEQGEKAKRKALEDASRESKQYRDVLLKQMLENLAGYSFEVVARVMRDKGLKSETFSKELLGQYAKEVELGGK